MPQESQRVINQVVNLPAGGGPVILQTNRVPGDGPTVYSEIVGRQYGEDAEIGVLELLLSGRSSQLPEYMASVRRNHAEIARRNQIAGFAQALKSAVEEQYLGAGQKRGGLLLFQWVRDFVMGVRYGLRNDISVRRFE